jgi:uncharacterized membrane protein
MKLSTRSRSLLGVAALLLAVAGFFPLWGVYLKAPQYPEGLGMHIRANTVTGVKENDLESINNLNHYIGMKRIVPDAIPELRYMPFIMGALALFGAVAALAGRRWLARTWVICFLLVAVAGLADFWKWEYDYGHDLDVENAIIKIPGMNYQPPLIGSRKLLNFTATSLPDVGGILAVASLAAGVLALVLDTRGRTRGVASAVAPALPPRVAVP